MTNKLQNPIDLELFNRLVAFRRDLHRHPELSGNEGRTARRVTDELRRIGVEFTNGVGGHGVVATIPGEDRNFCVALRADMDALPVEEQTGLDFASENHGVMHACGHDGHSAILLGAAELLAADKPPTDVKLIWQPSEELANGAQRMIDDGVLEGVDVIFGGHVDRHYSPGVIVVADGPVNASTDLFTIEIGGRGGHGARPHEALDAVVVGSLLVTALQTIVSREVDPARPSVVTVGVFDAGTAANVIAGHARLEGTIRSQDEEIREHLHRSIARIAKAIGDLHGAEVKVRLHKRTPPLVNSGDMIELGRMAVKGVGGDLREALHTVNMGGEDFACFLEHVRGLYVRFGAQAVGRESFPAHSSEFDFDERAIAYGAAWMNEVSRRAGSDLLARGDE